MLQWASSWNIFGCLGWAPGSRIATRLMYAHLGTGQQLSPKGLYCTNYLTLVWTGVTIFHTNGRCFHLHVCQFVCWVSLSNTDVSSALKWFPEGHRMKSTPCSEVRSGSDYFWSHLVSLAWAELSLGHGGGGGCWLWVSPPPVPGPPATSLQRESLLPGYIVIYCEALVRY